MRGLEKNHMGRGHTHTRTCRLLDQLGPEGRVGEKSNYFRYLLSNVSMIGDLTIYKSMSKKQSWNKTFVKIYFLESKTFIAWGKTVTDKSVFFYKVLSTAAANVKRHQILLSCTA